MKGCIGTNVAGEGQGLIPIPFPTSDQGAYVDLPSKTWARN